MKSLIVWLLVILTPSMALADDVLKDLDALGGNRDIVNKARELDPKNKVRIVQNRAVDRDFRFEFGMNYGMVTGGDPYLSSDNLGGRVDFHFTPRISLGVMHYQTSNELSSEGKRVYDNAQAAQQNGTNYTIPDSDYAESTTMAIINVYPLYGKLNLFNTGIAQFDLYGIGGYGQVKLGSGSTDTYTVGAGIGLWLSQHFTTRLEARYQTYEDQIISGKRQLDMTVITAGIGLML